MFHLLRSYHFINNPTNDPELSFLFVTVRSNFLRTGSKFPVTSRRFSVSRVYNYYSLNTGRTRIVRNDLCLAVDTIQPTLSNGEPSMQYAPVEVYVHLQLNVQSFALHGDDAYLLHSCCIPRSHLRQQLVVIPVPLRAPTIRATAVTAVSPYPPCTPPVHLCNSPPPPLSLPHAFHSLFVILAAGWRDQLHSQLPGRGRRGCLLMGRLVALAYRRIASRYCIDFRTRLVRRWRPAICNTARKCLPARGAPFFTPVHGTGQQLKNTSHGLRNEYFIYTSSVASSDLISFWQVLERGSFAVILFNAFRSNGTPMLSSMSSMSRVRFRFFGLFGSRYERDEQTNLHRIRLSRGVF